PARVHVLTADRTRAAEPDETAVRRGREPRPKSKIPTVFVDLYIVMHERDHFSICRAPELVHRADNAFIRQRTKSVGVFILVVEPVRPHPYVKRTSRVFTRQLD